MRQACGAPDAWRWGLRVMELGLDRQEMAGLSLYAEPEHCNADGVWEQDPRWRDEPLEEWGTMTITSAGVVVLATASRRV